ncbi:hypothetical protein [Nannocystis radixulma]|uniref:Uncharacterized protein n=1 Tax=Nannocystis radixulma TaxID=2995305 RepID=A0ABT5BDL7_9BACT|nr:hypothetical protein [Nannocystis radixulma]MDC0672226.1 hypothetical protein [Nannocystis radixulma]
MNLLRRHAPLLVAAALAVGLESLVTVEWSFPYCSSQEDGPASAVYGFPLPYIRWGGYSSLIYIFMPAAHLADLILLTCAVYLLIRRFVRRMAPPEHPRRRTILGLMGAALLVIAGLQEVFLIAVAERVPVLSIADDAYGYYTELRPVALTSSDLSDRCTPSAWWFPDGWKPDGGR